MSKLEDVLAEDLRLMTSAEQPWPAFVREVHFDWCCECPKAQHRKASGPPRHWYHAHFPAHCLGCHSEHEWRRGRAWRADFAYPEAKLLIEVDGSVYTQGRHTRGKGWEEDARKQARAVELGYRVMHVSGGQVKSGEARNLIGAALGVLR